MLIVDQDKLVARLRVRETDAARTRAVRDAPHRALLRKRFIRECE
jgi:hypothetical protein